MDATRFDALAKGLAGRLSRRAALRRGGAGLAVGLLATAGLAAPAAAQAASRYAVIRRYRLAAGTSVSALAGNLQNGYVPLLRQAPGFLDYEVIDASNGRLTTVTIFGTQAQEAAAAQQVAAWVQQNLAGLLPLPTEIESGPVLVSAEVCPPPGSPTPTVPPTAPSTAPATVPATVAPTAPPPAPPPCTGQGCACATGTEQPCDGGLVCCPQQPNTPGGPGVCQPPSQCACTDPSQPGVGCPCQTGTQNPCGAATLVCCPSTSTPGGPGTCVQDAIGCNPTGGPTATTGICTAEGCACHTGTQQPCDSGLSCCANQSGVPGGPGQCKSSC